MHTIQGVSRHILNLLAGGGKVNSGKDQSEIKDENKFRAEFVITASQRKTVNRRWRSMVAPSQVFSKVRVPFPGAVQRTGESTTAVGRKSIDFMLFAAWSEHLLAGIEIRDRRTTKRIVKFLRACYCLSEPVCYRHVAKEMKKICDDLEAATPLSLRQYVFHSCRHLGQDALWHGGLREGKHFCVHHFYVHTLQRFWSTRTLISIFFCSAGRFRRNRCTAEWR